MKEARLHFEVGQSLVVLRYVELLIKLDFSSGFDKMEILVILAHHQPIYRLVPVLLEFREV